jgi:hypothetical protein
VASRLAHPQFVCFWLGLTGPVAAFRVAFLTSVQIRALLPRMSSRWWRTFVGIVVACGICTPASRAVVPFGGDGTQNVTPPPDDFGFRNVGQVFNTADGFFNSGVYLGHRWVLSAYHPVRNGAGGFQFGPVLFRDALGNDIPFTVDPSSAVRLKNADNSFTDLALFRLTTEPAFLPEVRLASTTPLGGSSVVMAGNGLTRDPNETHWNVNTTPNPDVWTETTAAGDRQGYKWGNLGQALRWGTNELEFNVLPTNRTFNVNGGFGAVVSVKTDFDSISGQAQGAGGDSGGAVFYKNGNTWELIGIMETVDAFDGQPGNTAVFGSGLSSGNNTFAADIPTYRSQILAVVPEPGSGLLAVVCACALLATRWRGRLTGKS